MIRSLIYFNLLLLSAITPITVAAKAKVSNAVPCKSKVWTGDEKTPLRKISMSLNQKPRAEVIQMMWGEVLKKDQSKAVAFPILQFLTGTESKEKTRGYFKSISILMTDGLLPNETLAQWPLRPKIAKPVSLPLEELCQLYQKTQ